MSTTSPGPRRRDRVADRGAPVEVPFDRDGRGGTPATISSTIAAGSSERGLSVVTTATSAARAATSPITRPLRAVAVAAAAEHDDHAARASRRRRARRRARHRARRACARSRRSTAKSWPASTRSIRPGTTIGASRPATIASSSKPDEERGRRGGQAFTTLNGPTSDDANGDRAAAARRELEHGAVGPQIDGAAPTRRRPRHRPRNG